MSRIVRFPLQDEVVSNLSFDEEVLPPTPRPDFSSWLLRGIEPLIADDEISSPLPSGSWQGRVAMDAVRVRYVFGTPEVVPPAATILDDDVGSSGRLALIADALASRWPQPIEISEDELPTPPSIIDDDGGATYVSPDLGYQVIPVPSTWDQDEWPTPGVLGPEEEYLEPEMRRWPDPVQLRFIPVPSDDSDLPSVLLADDDNGVQPPIRVVWIVGPMPVPLPSRWDQDDLPSVLTAPPDEDFIPASALRPSPLLTYAPVILWDQGDVIPILLDEDFAIPRVIDASYYDAPRPRPYVWDDGYSPVLGIPSVLTAIVRLVPVFGATVRLKPVIAGVVRVNPTPRE